MISIQPVMKACLAHSTRSAALAVLTASQLFLSACSPTESSRPGDGATNATPPGVSPASSPISVLISVSEFVQTGVESDYRAQLAATVVDVTGQPVDNAFVIWKFQLEGTGDGLQELATFRVTSARTAEVAFPAHEIGKLTVSAIKGASRTTTTIYLKQRSLR